MATYKEMEKTALADVKVRLDAIYEQYKAQGLKLNMARGKPGADQLDLTMPMMDVLNADSDYKTADGVDTRNYGELTGIQEAKVLFGDMMGVSPEEMIIGGSSSLTLMYDSVARALLTGVLDSEKPWGKYDKIKFICPVPGYDRHFTICEFLGIEMINVPLTEWGPDVDAIEALTANDDSIKGMWCVPKYTNPLGSVYSDEAVRRLANLKTAAKDFRIFWDNAYAVHHVYQDIPLLNLLEECKKAGNPNRAFMFGSTSKISFPGAGVSFIAASKENIDFITKQLNAQSIGWDKINMLRHVRFFKDMDGIRAHMDQHATILKPKFDAVLHAFEQELSGLDIGTWVKPLGGYFITYIAEKGCAKRIVQLCKEAGVIMTSAGATHPYGKDPEDRYIRIAPTFPTPEELEKAMQIFCVSAKLAAAEKFLAE